MLRVPPKAAISKFIIQITISSIVIGLKKLLFYTNSIAKLLPESSISQSQPIPNWGFLQTILEDSSVVFMIN